MLALDRMDVPGAFRRAPQRLRTNQIQKVFEVARRRPLDHGECSPDRSPHDPLDAAV